jgi:hypothetical protein
MAGGRRIRAMVLLRSHMVHALSLITFLCPLCYSVAALGILAIVMDTGVLGWISSEPLLLVTTCRLSYVLLPGG